MARFPKGLLLAAAVIELMILTISGSSDVHSSRKAADESVHVATTAATQKPSTASQELKLAALRK
jgi:hypothetical protein